MVASLDIASAVLAAALAAQVSVFCPITVEGRSPERHGPAALTAACPGDIENAAGAQAAADRSLAAMALDVPQSSRFRVYRYASELELVADNRGGWTVRPGQALIWRWAVFPARTVEQGARHFACAAAFRPDSAGRPGEPPIICLSDFDTEGYGELAARYRSHFEAAAREAASGYRFAPVDIAYCLDEQMNETAVVNNRPTPPTPDFDLPNLCVDP